MKNGKIQCNDKSEFSKLLENLNKIVGYPSSDFDHAENFDTLVETYENELDYGLSVLDKMDESILFKEVKPESLDIKPKIEPRDSAEEIGIENNNATHEIENSVEI